MSDLQKVRGSNESYDSYSKNSLCRSCNFTNRITTMHNNGLSGSDISKDFSLNYAFTELLSTLKILLNFVLCFGYLTQELLVCTSSVQRILFLNDSIKL